MRGNSQFSYPRPRPLGPSLKNGCARGSSGPGTGQPVDFNPWPLKVDGAHGGSEPVPKALPAARCPGTSGSRRVTELVKVPKRIGKIPVHPDSLRLLGSPACAPRLASAVWAAGDDVRRAFGCATPGPDGHDRRASRGKVWRWPKTKSALRW
jgi:hypothetical protein